MCRKKKGHEGYREGMVLERGRILEKHNVPKSREGQRMERSTVRKALNTPSKKDQVLSMGLSSKEVIWVAYMMKFFQDRPEVWQTGAQTKDFLLLRISPAYNMSPQTLILQLGECTCSQKLCICIWSFFPELWGHLRHWPNEKDILLSLQFHAQASHHLRTTPY